MIIVRLAMVWFAVVGLATVWREMLWLEMLRRIVPWLAQVWHVLVDWQQCGFITLGYTSFCRTGAEVIFWNNRARMHLSVYFLLSTSFFQSRHLSRYKTHACHSKQNTY